MKFGKFSDYKGGWLVGDFKPSLFKTDVNDVGVLYCKKGDKGDGHFHKKHTEYNIILDGSVLIEDKKLYTGDIFIYEPKDRSYVEFLENTILLVVKNPATKDDKYYE